MDNPSPATARYRDVAFALTALAVLFVLWQHLLPALFAGLLVHELVLQLAPRLGFLRASGRRSTLLAVGLLSGVIIAALVLLLIALIAFFRSDAGSLPALLQKLAETIESARKILPEWVFENLPGDPDEIKDAIGQWLRHHAADMRNIGREVGRAVAHALIGMVAGAMVALSGTATQGELRPLARELGAQIKALSAAFRRVDVEDSRVAFRRVVFAQVYISANNTVCTWLYIGVLLPMLGVHLPFPYALVAITFIAGLLPVLGNLISNTIIVVASLAQGFGIAVGSLVFLILIHKFEYFLNARIIGSQIRARAWELLVAMLAMEASFGLAGLVAAPVLYAYLKDECVQRSWV